MPRCTPINSVNQLGDETAKGGTICRICHGAVLNRRSARRDAGKTRPLPASVSTVARCAHNFHATRVFLPPLFFCDRRGRPAVAVVPRPICDAIRKTHSRARDRCNARTDRTLACGKTPSTSSSDGSYRPFYSHSTPLHSTRRDATRLARSRGYCIREKAAAAAGLSRRFRSGLGE